MLRPLLACVVVAALTACSNDLEEGDSKGRSNAQDAPDGTPDGAGRGGGAENDELDVGVLTVIATGLASPSEFVVHAGTAYVATRSGLVMVSPKGVVEKLDEDAGRLAADDQALVWASSQGITSAPFADVRTRTLISAEQWPMNLVAHDGRAFFTLTPSTGSDDGPENAGSLLQATIGKTASSQPVTTNAAMNYTEIAADSSHVFFFAPPNRNEAEVRRVRRGGGESERIGFVPGGAGGSMAVTESTVFFDVYGKGLYAVPKGGGLAARHVFEGFAPVADPSGVYFLSADDKIVQIHHVDIDGENRRLVAQHYGDTILRLAIDETGLYALSGDHGALYKVSRK